MSFTPAKPRQLLLLVVLTFAFALPFSRSAAQSAWNDYPELPVTVTDQSITVATTVPAGFYRLVVDDRTELHPEVFFVRIADHSNVHEVHEALHAISAASGEHDDISGALATLRSVASLVGGRMTPETVIIELKEGEYTVATSIDDADGQPVSTTLSVTANADAAPAPTADVRIVMAEFSFAVPTDLVPGLQTWELVNSGDQIHHLILMRYNEGVTFEDVEAFMSAEGPPSGPPPFEMVVASELLTTSVSNYFQFDLAPGNYLAICFLPDENSGAPHFALGMMQEFGVPGN